LRGDEYWSGAARYLHKVKDISALFGQALYVGTQLTVAEMRERLDGFPPETIYSGSLFVGGRTPLGSAHVVARRNEHGPVATRGSRLDGRSRSARLTIGLVSHRSPPRTPVVGRFYISWRATRQDQP
jgi:hypothetical protein